MREMDEETVYSPRRNNLQRNAQEDIRMMQKQSGDGTAAPSGRVRDTLLSARTPRGRNAMENYEKGLREGTFRSARVKGLPTLYSARSRATNSEFLSVCVVSFDTISN